MIEIIKFTLILIKQILIKLIRIILEIKVVKLKHKYK